MTSEVGKRNIRDIAAGLPPGEPATVAISAAAAATTQAVPPAGGTGATAGAYDTAANRDLMITSITDARTDIAAQKVELDKLIVEYALLRAVLVDHNFIA